MMTKTLMMIDVILIIMMNEHKSTSILTRIHEQCDAVLRRKEFKDAKVEQY